MRTLAVMACFFIATTFAGCLPYGNHTDVTSVPISSASYPPTSTVTLYFRPPSATERCTPIELITVAGSRFEEADELLPKMRQRAMDAGADALFSVAIGNTARTEGDLLLEVDPKNKPTVYSAYTVSGLAARCDLRTTAESAPPPDAYGYTFGTDVQATVTACRRQGWNWHGSSCTRPSGSFISVDPRFCAGRLCVVDATTDLTKDSRKRTGLPWEFQRAASEITARYGLPSRRDVFAPDHCQEGDVIACVARGETRAAYQWAWATGESITLVLTSVSGRPTVRTVVDVSHAGRAATTTVAALPGSR